MRKEASLPVRLSPEQKERLQNAAGAMGVTPSALIRIMVTSFVDEFERCGGKMTLPPQWQKSESIFQPEVSVQKKATGIVPVSHKIHRSGGKRKTQRVSS